MHCCPCLGDAGDPAPPQGPPAQSGQKGGVRDAAAAKIQALHRGKKGREKDPPTGKFREDEVNMHPNPMQSIWPNLRFLSPAATPHFGGIIDKDSLDRTGMSGGATGGFRRSGCVRNIWFDPRQVCRCLRHCYGVEKLYGFRGGYNHKPARERGMRLAVVGIPKSIDNDVVFFDRTFGFETAVQAGCSVIRNGHVEATSCRNGVAVVKLMGRDAGFVARNASLASTLADAVLIPEVEWKVEALLDHV
eukprot:gene31016-8144_t